MKVICECCRQQRISVKCLPWLLAKLFAAPVVYLCSACYDAAGWQVPPSGTGWPKAVQGSVE